jgi:hypothetical protein
LELDHAVIAVSDLEAAARDIEARHGLSSIAGGRHPGWGTANRIVPLGGTYLELIAAVDKTEAAHSTFGSWVAGAASEAGRLLGWAVRTDRIDDFARQHGLTASAGSRPAGGGQVIRWRVAGIEQAVEQPSLPFVIEWAPGTPLPGRASVRHPAGGVALAGLQLTGDPDGLAAWLGPHNLPITIDPGEPALTGIMLTATTGELVLSSL